MALPNAFGPPTIAATGAQLDQNFAALGALTPIPCTIAGTNSLVLTPAALTPTIPAYVNYQVFCGTVAVTNTGVVTIGVGSLAALSVYKDAAGPSSGPIALVGGELVAKNIAFFVYDSALNSGSGGFHLLSTTVRPGNSSIFTSVPTATGTTLTAAALSGNGNGQSVISRTGTSGVFSDTTDTATNIIAALPGVAVGTIFRIHMMNFTSSAQTLLGGTGVTISGPTTTVATLTSRDMIGLVTSVSSPAVTIYM